MAWHIPTYLILALFLAILSLALTFLAWQRRSITGNLPLVLLMLANTIWLIVYYCSLVADNPAVKVNWHQAGHLIVFCIPTLILALILTFVGHTHWLKGKRLGLLLIEPVLIILIALTNPLHRLVWVSVQLDTVDEFTHITPVYGPGAYLNIVYTSFVVILSFVLLWRYARRAPTTLQRQAFLLISCLVLLVTGVLLDLLAPPILHGIRYSTLGILLIGILLVALLDTRQNRLILPLARDAILENMSDGVIVLDPQDRVVDLNATASQMLGINPEQAIGFPIDSVWSALPAWPNSHALSSNQSEIPREVIVSQGENRRTLDLRVSAILDRQGVFTGRLAVLRDITPRKRAEATLQRRDLILQAVSFAAEQFLKSTTWEQNIREVLTRLGIATQVCRVYLFEKINQPGALNLVLRHEWLDGDTTPLVQSRKTSLPDSSDSQQPRWIESLSQGQPVYGLMSDFPEVDRLTLSNPDVTTIALVPIFTSQQWWGYLGFDDSTLGRVWSSVEIDALSTAASTLGAAIERSRLYAQARSNASELGALYNASAQLLHPGRSLQDLAQRITQSVVQEFDSTVCSLILLNPETRCLELLAQVGFPPGDYPPLSLDANTVGTATIHQAESIYVPDVSQDPRYLMIANTTRSQLTFPLLADGAVIGVLNIESPQLNGFDEQARRILGNYASNAALAIRNVLLVKETEERAIQLSQLNEITRDAIGNYSFKDTLRKIVNDLVQVFKADICFISLWDDQQKIIVHGAASGPYDKVYQAILPKQAETTLTSAVLDDTKPIFISDFRNSELISQRIAQAYPVQVALAVPMIINKQKLGSLIFAFNEQRSFSEAEIKVGEQFANQVGLAISKAWALELARQSAREADNLRQAVAAISSSLELPQVLESILTHLAQVMPYDSACVFLRESTHLRAVAGRGLPDPIHWLNHQYPLDELYLQTQRTKQPTLLRDASQDKRFQHWGETSYVRGWMGVPLVIRERVTGILTLDSRQPNAFDLNHSRLAAAFADQVAIAIENARLYQHVQWEAMNDPLTRLYNRRGLFDLGQREVERSRRFGHPLTAIMIDIDLFKNVNDTYGHTTGDLVLSVLADELIRQVRDVDIVGRYGGEEIVVLLPETSLDGGLMAAERLRQSVEQLTIPGEQGMLGITISLGVAELTSRVTDLTTLIDQSDSAMYQAKQAGRNRVCAYQPSASK